MHLSIFPLADCFAGEVSGVDLQQPLGPKTVSAIESAMDRYAVLVFRDQNISDDEQLTFSQNFGPIESSIGGNITKLAQTRVSKLSSRMSPIWIKTRISMPGTTGGDYLILVTACGIQTVRFVPFRLSTHYCLPDLFR
ncbi:MAG: hypothetical protein CM1200mP18_02710 [Gammaproteobacteria bacterium]|nr:MAG: hypothetical protein CM1200mP18_02710 [Gammaproteobacteria bacterium]